MIESLGTLFHWASRRVIRRPLHITLTVSEDDFVFRIPGHEVIAKARTGMLAGQHRLATHFTAALGYLPLSPLPLFPRGPEAAVAADQAGLRFPALVAVMSQGIGDLMSAAHRHRRPELTILGALSLDASLHGYQYELLRQAAFASGAYAVTFDVPDDSPLASVAARRQDPATLRDR